MERSVQTLQLSGGVVWGEAHLGSWSSPTLSRGAERAMCRREAAGVVPKDDPRRIPVGCDPMSTTGLWNPELWAPSAPTSIIGVPPSRDLLGVRLRNPV